MNINKLKGKLVENEKNVGWLGEILGCDRSTAYRKLNDGDLSKGDKLTIGDAIKIKEALNLSDAEACEIFLA